MKRRLRKDIVIPAGTVFVEAPGQQWHGYGTMVSTIGLTPDTSGDLFYYVGESGSFESEQLAEWFEDG